MQSMEPVATSGVIQEHMQNSATEVQDFDKVVSLYWTRVYRFALASVNDPDLAETLTQDCFMKAFRARNGFRGESSVHTWLMRITVNLIRSFARNRRLQFWKRIRGSVVDPSTIGDWIPDRNVSPETKALLREQVEAIWRAAQALSERQRTVFLLRFVEDMSVLEIVEATGLKEGAVKVHLHRALRTIRSRIGKMQ